MEKLVMVTGIPRVSRNVYDILGLEEPNYEKFSIDSPFYSNCIVGTINDEIIAYEDRVTGEWHTTDYLMESRPETMELDFFFRGQIDDISIEEMRKLIPEDELFMELL